MVRLGDGVYVRGNLDKEAVQRTIKAFVAFKQVADALGVQRIVAVGTSALREAKDSLDFIEQIHKASGINLHVISGEEEARLIAVGVISNDTELKGSYALVDIGGGSTEVSLCRKRKVLQSKSFPLGTARLTQLFLKGSPPKPARAGGPHPIEQLRRHIREILRKGIGSELNPRTKLIIGSSGTIRSLIRLQRALGKKRKKSITRSTLTKLVHLMSELDTSELLLLPGMTPRRVDMILAGGVLLEELMGFLKAKKVSITDFSLRDGLIEEEQQNFRDGLGSEKAERQSPESASLEAAQLFARTFERVELCKRLFDELRTLHQLNSSWLKYVLAAVQLRDQSQPERDQLRISRLRKACLPLEKNWEYRFVRNLVLERKGPSGSVNKDDDRSRAFTVLSAILGVVDSLQPSQVLEPIVHRVDVAGHKVRLVLSRKRSRIPAHLQKLRGQRRANIFRDRAGLFHRAFKRALEVKKIA